MISGTNYRLNDRISVTQVEDELVLLNLNNGAYYGLNHIGLVLIRAIESQIPLEQAVQQTSERYQLEYSVVDDDFQQLINQLMEQSLLINQDRP